MYYKETKDFTPQQLQRLFLSVHWQSGSYPEKLVLAMKNSSHVISAWDNEKLVGLVRSIDDKQTIAFIHYLLVDPNYQGKHIGSNLMQKLLQKYDDILYIKVMPSDPNTISFYEKFGFKQYDNYSAMVIKKL